MAFARKKFLVHAAASYLGEVWLYNVAVWTGTTVFPRIAEEEQENAHIEQIFNSRFMSYSRPSREDISSSPDLYDLYDLYDLAHVAGGGALDLHDLGRVSLGWIRYVIQILHRISRLKVGRSR